MVVRVELAWGGLFSLAVVVFCVFLWMFLLGIWAGQSILALAGEVAAHFQSYFATVIT